MKTLTALAAVAALAASVSIAGAQTTMKKSDNLIATGSAFCNTSKATGASECKYATMADCQKVAEPMQGTCVPNPKKKATTGSGSSEMNKTEKKK